MGTRLVHALATTLAADGMRAVRFDYRGVGRSEGTYGRGIGEAADAAAVLERLHDDTGRPVRLVGFSFGGAVAIRVAAEQAARTEWLVCIATPAALRDADLRPAEDAARVHTRVHLIHGTADDVVPMAQAEALAAAFPAPPRWHRIEGADHFLNPEHVPRAVAAVRRALADEP